MQDENTIRVDLDDLNLLEEDTKRLQTQIKQMISAELEIHLSKELERTKSEKEIMQDENTIRVDLDDLNLPEEDTKRLQTQIQQMISAEFNRHKSNLQSTDQICAGTVY